MMLGFGHIFLNHVSILQNNVNFSHDGHVTYVGHVSVRDRISAGDKSDDDGSSNLFIFVFIWLLIQSRVFRGQTRKV